MLFLAEHRSRAARLSDYLPWAAMVAPVIVLDKMGASSAPRVFGSQISTAPYKPN
jgi:hypothetical protein